MLPIIIGWRGVGGTKPDKFASIHSNFHSQFCPEFTLDLLVIQSPFPIHELIFVSAREESDRDLEAARLPPAATVEEAGRWTAERFLEKGIGIECLFDRAQAADYQLA